MKRIYKILHILRSIHKTIYLNFKYLPLKQAIRLPIILYKPKFVACKGKVVIESEYITLGMIQLGFNQAHAYPHSGIVWENNGGTVVFKGKALIGNNSSLCIGPNAEVVFGKNFSATTTFKSLN